MATLIIDTSAGVATAILAEGKTVISSYSAQGSTLSLIHEGIALVEVDSKVPIDELDEVAVVQGPGSWTGLHNGVTTAKTIAQVLGIPIIPLSMLDVLAMSQREYDGIICPVIDAKHEAIYSAIHRVDSDGIELVAAAMRRSVSELIDELNQLPGEKLILGTGTAIIRLIGAAILGSDTKFSDITYPTVDAFVAAVEAKRDSAVVGNAQFSLVPDYMQDDFTAALPFSRSFG